MKRTLIGFCIVTLFALATEVGCSSSGGTVSASGGSNGSGGNSSSGGSNGSGGSSSSGGSNGSGGSTGSGGDSSSGGSSASGGSSGSGGSTVACPTASGALITDAPGSGGQVGTPYNGADTGLTPPKTTVADGAMTIDIDTGTASTMYPWAFFAMAFSSCVDASAYQGVSFNISGTLNEGCTIQFSTVDKEHNATANNGTCTVSSCYPSAKIFTLPADPTDVTINFADQTGGGADPSAAVVDPKQIMAIQWQVTPPATGNCKGTLKLDNITFK